MERERVTSCLIRQNSGLISRKRCVDQEALSATYFISVAHRGKDDVSHHISTNYHTNTLAITSTS